MAEPLKRGPKRSAEPWFIVDSRAGGVRTLNQQLVGLAPLFEVIRGKSVLDLGCAEGCISHMLVKFGAEFAHGVDIRPDHIEYALKLAGAGVKRSQDPERRKGQAPGYHFEAQNLNTWRPSRKYDVVLALMVLHNLQDPARACAEFAEFTNEFLIVRLPPKSAPQDIANFDVTYKEVGTAHEVTVYYKRVK